MDQKAHLEKAAQSRIFSSAVNFFSSTLVSLALPDNAHDEATVQPATTKSMMCEVAKIFARKQYLSCLLSLDSITSITT